MSCSCPSCFRPLSSDLYAFACAGSCLAQPDQRAGYYAAGQVSRPPIVHVPRPEGDRRWQAPAQVPCRVCNNPTSRQACPECHFLLPPGWREYDVTTLAFGGAVATGKSLYIGVMVEQLDRLLQMATPPTARRFATRDTRTNYQANYEKPLFEAMGVVLSTRSATTAGAHQREPLVFDLGLIGGVKRMLVVRDVAGEDLERAEGTEPFLSFFAFADGVVFMFDPLAVQTILHQLEGLIPRPREQDMVRVDPARVVGTVLRLMSGASGHGLLGVAISKFDVLQQLAGVRSDWGLIMANRGAAYSQDPSLSSFAYDETDGELLDAEVRSLLIRLNVPELVSQVDQDMGARARFFAVSALGAAVSGEQQSPNGISPFRCLDPVKWILTRTGVLPSGESRGLLGRVRR